MALELSEPAQELTQHRPPGDAVAEVDTEQLHKKENVLTTNFQKLQIKTTVLNDSSSIHREFHLITNQIKTIRAVSSIIGQHDIVEAFAAVCMF